MDKDRRFFTARGFGKITGVAPVTVLNWIRDGKLISSHTPGGHCRISKDSAIRFLREYGYEIPNEWKAQQEIPA